MYVDRQAGHVWQGSPGGGGGRKIIISDKCFETGHLLWPELYFNLGTMFVLRCAEERVAW